ncbi:MULTISPECIES: DAK2 domain-containing protein [unclassified Streptomyces]|uniref:DAK2 domain-containing protein n=1 Tax=unclassified Streptomyces TaxID=2593676 RepID=UPI000361811E|nr:MULTISPECIES: DAK2 domain-containing protein [unclassified Streptomyces]MYQ80622.1 DAK2 domain-containing protein [Streptomyces sp. SID4923]OKJ02659.1 dihydroxyacetone kinase [Streptomyces sp. CB01249]
MPQTADEPDAVAVRSWCSLALEALGREREAIDAINVYPVADGDTGTNLYLTVESAAAAVEAVFAAHATGTSVPSAADAVRAMAHGALIGARGNSGTILAQLLRGMAGVLAEGTGGDRMRLALAQAAAWAREAVAHPVEGTVLTVADRAAAAAAQAAPGADTAEVARAAYEGARAALDATPGQLPALARAGVVDAGGRGLVTLLGALVEAVSGRGPERPYETPVPFVPVGGGDAECPAGDDGDGGGPAFEVIYLLEAGDEAVERLRARLDALGDSLVVVGGDGLWNVHVHVDDAGAAVEAGVEAGRPYRIRITHFAADRAHARPEPARRAVVVVVPGDGLAALCREAGATTVLARPGEPPASGELADAVRRAHAREVVLLPNDADLRHTAAAAAEQARAHGVRVAVIPTRAAVQGIAALAVHEPDRSFDEDVVAMTSAAGATRYAELAVAERQSWTTAGICQAGDILGLIDGDVAVIGQDVPGTARKVLDRMLAAGGELVTLVLGENTPPTLAEALEQHVRDGHLAVDTTTYRGGHQGAPLLIGVE